MKFTTTEVISLLREGMQFLRSISRENDSMNRCFDSQTPKLSKLWHRFYWIDYKKKKKILHRKKKLGLREIQSVVTLFRWTRRNNNGRYFILFFRFLAHHFASLFLKRIAFLTASNEWKAHVLSWNLALHFVALHLSLSFSVSSSSWLVHAIPTFVHFCKKSRIRTVYIRPATLSTIPPSQSFENFYRETWLGTLMNINLKFRERKPRVERRYRWYRTSSGVFYFKEERGLSLMDNWNDSFGLEWILVNFIPAKSLASWKFWDFCCKQIICSYIL